MTKEDKNSLQNRLDKYINHELSDPVAIGLICELRAHLKAANKGAEFWSQLNFNHRMKVIDLERRLEKLEGGK